MNLIIIKKFNYTLLAIVAVFFLSACSSKPITQVQKEIAIPLGKIFFFSKTCPHCTLVEQYITTNNIRQKLYFISRDITTDQEAYDLMPVIGKKCGLTDQALGVPLFWDGSKCYLGKENIINYFSTLP